MEQSTEDLDSLDLLLELALTDVKQFIQCLATMIGRSPMKPHIQKELKHWPEADVYKETNYFLQ